MTTDTLIVERGTLADIDLIINLHNKYLLANLLQEQIQDGFIRVNYTSEDLKNIINDNAIVVAKNSHTIVGYYLIGHTSKSQTLEYQFSALNKYSINGIKLNELNVACGAQAVVEKSYRGYGLIEKMLQKLKEQVKFKYDYIFSSITKINSSSYKVNINLGYKIVGEDEIKYFVCLKIE